MTPAERQDLDLRVYFTSTNTSNYRSLQHSVGHLVNSLFTVREDSSIDEHGLSSELKRSKTTGHKAALDYAYALQECLEKSESPYVGILEDDILMADGWLARTRVALQEIESRAAGRWLDLRLFNQVRSLGWSSSQMINQTSFILIVIVSTIIMGCTFVSRRRGQRQLLAVPTILALCFTTVPIFVVLFFRAGKASILPPPRGISVQAWGPCTQGNIFARERLPSLIQALRDEAPYKPHDLIIRDHAWLNDFARYVLTPSQIQHIGFSSILSTSRSLEDFPWSVAFEDLKVADLVKEHADMVRKVYQH